MTETIPTSIRADIMQMLKSKFGRISFWSRVEAEIALRCAELPEPNTPTKKSNFIKQLRSLKRFISDQDISDEDLSFIEDEIILHEQSSMISLYEEKEDEIDPGIIEAYSRLGKGTEGIVAIPQDYNYQQLSRLSNGVYRKTGLVKFYISNEQRLYGKIVAEIFEHSQEIPIATVVESIKRNKETGEAQYTGIKLFGEKYSLGSVKVIKEINLPFYVYRFISESNKDLILITTQKCDIGDYVVTGVRTECADHKMLSDSARLPTKLPFFFAQKIQNRIIKFKNHKEFEKRLKELDICKPELFDYPFAVSKNNKQWKLLQPTWYKWLIWAWITHKPQGIFNNYPLHILQIGPKMSGKSLLLNSLHHRSKETRSIFSGSSSTLKHLVPSFKYNPARLGYLAESNRFSFCDEFLRCLTNTRTTKDGSQREESVAIMNDLLEHQKREAGSGVSRVNVNMTSRIIATTNPVRDIKNVESLIGTFDESFLSRWLIYYQSDDHVQIIRKSRDSDLENYDFELSTNDWVSILDYLHTFPSEYDLKKVEEIHRAVPKNLTENLNKHYDARHMHHIECLIDGIVKARCLMEKDMSFKANEEDYVILKNIWLSIVKSWMDLKNVKRIEIKERIHYLPEDCQYLYWKICGQKKPLDKIEVESIALKSMSRKRFYEVWTILSEMGLVNDSNGMIRPYYMLNKNNGIYSHTTTKL